MARLGAFVSGLLFGLGLLLAGMADPAKVLAFLDLADNWDPSLALVMAGAIGVAALPLLLAGRRSRALLGGTMQLPTRRDVDARLVGGSLLFGVGWGIAGICPGPAVALLLVGHWQALLFVLAMLAGMLIFAALEGQRGR
ncbi:DUF6691 family protein [Pseudomonas sp. NCCP-436]|uniref:DUF6691 family protein n=1 Tax=Pseudomonas sp. NCCP-436 TaxID=2842481 RepID=UPI001C7E6015|nr:DUF6691 family protein [Pseudomonas sp. NCCP-436]GIZ13926.1 membrane protein [Pseudomonas sp. NCCP-436]